jgi:hypothetical protein
MGYWPCDDGNRNNGPTQKDICYQKVDSSEAPYFNVELLDYSLANFVMSFSMPIVVYGGNISPHVEVYSILNGENIVSNWTIYNVSSAPNGEYYPTAITVTFNGTSQTPF